jgi:hypothetical protein
LKKNNIVFFGTKSNVVRGMYMLESRINKIKKEDS